MEFKYTEITMRLMLGLMCVVNDGCLVEPLNWLALYHRKVYHLLKTILAQLVHPSKYFHSAIVLSVQ